VTGNAISPAYADQLAAALREKMAHVGLDTGMSCLPVSTDQADEGWRDAYQGWYDVQGCGLCLDYCRWVGNSGSGGDPSTRQQAGESFWSCRLAGTAHAYTDPGYFPEPWAYAKCDGEGATSDPGSDGLSAGGEAALDEASSAKR